MLNLKKYDKKRSLEAWMKSIMINVVIDDFRKNKNYVENNVSTEPTELVYLVKYDNKEKFEGLTESVQKKLDTMNPLTKIVFNLYAIDGFKHKEIAKMLKIPEGTCHYHFSVAKKNLKEYVNKEFDLGHTI